MLLGLVLGILLWPIVADARVTPSVTHALPPTFHQESETVDSSTAANPSPAVATAFDLPIAQLSDPYGPRPANAVKLRREQIIRYALQNPLVNAASEQIKAMTALRMQAKFSWVPVIETSLFLSPGANIECDDIQLQAVNGAPQEFQWCRPRSNDNLDLRTIKGYFGDLKNAGISLRFRSEFIVPIYTFGKLRRLRKMAKVGVALAQLRKLQVQQETILKTQEAYLTLLLTRESISILHDVWGKVSKHRKTIVKQLGLGSEFDEDEASVNLDRDPDDLVELELVEIELARKMREARKIEALALSSLWLLTGDVAPPHFDIAETELVPDKVESGLDAAQDYSKMALQKRPEAKMTTALVELRSIQERLTRSQFYPDFGLAVQINAGYANKSDNPNALYYSGRLNYSNIVAALGLRWQLDFHNRIFTRNKARAELRQAEFQNQAAKRLLQLEVEKAYRDVRLSQEETELSQLAIQKSMQLLISQEAKNSVGGGSYRDLGKALRKWAESEFDRLKAIQGQNLATSRLERAVGMKLAVPRSTRLSE